MHINNTAIYVVLLVCALPLLSACDRLQSEGASIHGTVTFDGKPIPKATIVFRPTGQTKGKSIQFQVVDGRYKGKQEEGVFGGHCVEIYGERQTGSVQPEQNLPPGAQAAAPSRQYLPESYNTRSSLKFDIQPGDNEANFTLSSRGT